jgi:benzoyl-CoA reductase subunit A
MAQESKFWQWREYNWVDQAIDWKTAEIISVGVDVGSLGTKTVILADGKLLAYSNMRTASGSAEAALRATEWALRDIKPEMTPEDFNYTVGTGYGRVNVPFAQRSITEIACHARGANVIYGNTVRTVLDMGGQDCKAINCDEKGKVTAFLMNDKCAAGTGRGVEVIADLLGVHIEKIGEMSFQVDEEPPPVSSTCVVFAKTEATSLLRQGWPKSKVLAAYCSAMAHRVVTLLERIDVKPDFAITGGISKNIGITRRVEKELDIRALDPHGWDPQIAGALGAAMFAKALHEKDRKKTG